MTVIAAYSQQPAERLDYDIYYKNSPDETEDWLVSGDTLASAETAVSPSGLDVEKIVMTDRVKLWVFGGTNGSTYKITITVTTALGRVKQDEIRIKIKDI